MKSVSVLAADSLESVALALSQSAGNALRSDALFPLKDIRTIFSDRVVAYAYLSDSSGRIVFHTNPKLIGSLLPAPVSKELFKYTSPGGRTIMLQTGISAHEFTYPVERQNGQEMRLRIVLNSLPADKLVTKAREMWWIVGWILVAFWCIGIFFGWLLIHYLHLQEELEQRKHMALIGQMTAVLSHEIRNALGSIKGYTQWVGRKMHPDDALRQPVAMALNGIERVETLLNELLLYSKEEVYRPERINAVLLLKQCILSFNEWRGEIVWRGETEAWVVADREKLYRVFFNVIQNAFQAMGDTGKLEASHEKTGRWCRIRIADSGPGVLAKDIDLLFTPFYTSKINGTGIGLAYSKKVIEAMGGRIGLANRPNVGGAVMTIDLPAQREGGLKNG